MKLDKLTASPECPEPETIKFFQTFQGLLQSLTVGESVLLESVKILIVSGSEAGTDFVF